MFVFAWVNPVFISGTPRTTHRKGRFNPDISIRKGRGYPHQLVGNKRSCPTMRVEGSNLSTKKGIYETRTSSVVDIKGVSVHPRLNEVTSELLNRCSTHSCNVPSKTKTQQLLCCHLRFLLAIVWPLYLSVERPRFTVTTPHAMSPSLYLQVHFR